MWPPDLPEEFVPARELSRSDKALVLAGSFAGRDAVAKVLLCDDPYWRDRFAQDIALHQQPGPPGTAAPPRLYDTDGQTVLIVEYLSGPVLHSERYPDDVRLDHVAAVLTTLDQLHRWRPPAEATTAWPPGRDEAGELARADAAGWGQPTDWHRLQQLLAATTRAEPNHGDVVPPNAVITHHGARLIDWEHASLRRPGWDLALLHTTLARVPTAQAVITAHATVAGVWSGFLLNRALVLAREGRIHAELPAGPLRSHRLDLLRHAWADLSTDLHRKPPTP